MVSQFKSLGPFRQEHVITMSKALNNPYFYFFLGWRLNDPPLGLSHNLDFYTSRNYHRGRTDFRVL